MAAKKRDDAGRAGHDESWLSEEQLTRCARADLAEPFRSPVPTRIVSNGEYMPPPQTKDQKRVEARIQELTETTSKKLGISRRQFLKSTGGMAAAFLAMNEVFGRFFKVDAAELLEPAAYAVNALPEDVFVFDDQLHFVRGSLNVPVFSELRAAAQGPSSAAYGIPQNPWNKQNLPDELGNPWSVWNPALIGMPIGPEQFQFLAFVKNVFLDSQVHVGLLSNVGPGVVEVPGAVIPPRTLEEAMGTEVLTAAQTIAARNFINSIAGSQRLLGHGMLYVGRGNLDWIRYQAENFQPDSWKGYTISTAAKLDTDPNSPMRKWRLDDEEVAYPTWDLISQYQASYETSLPGFGNICIHKGLAPDEPPLPENGHPGDVPKAAADWPNLNFIIYHACLWPLAFARMSYDDILSGRTRDGVPDIRYSTLLAQLASPFPNVYAELGTTFASTVVSFPTVTAHLLGQFLKYLGPDRIVFGSDSLWYGAPQWQLEALWRLEIPEQLQAQYGYPALDENAKRLILGLNSARIYGLAAFPGSYTPVPTNYEALMPADLRQLFELPTPVGGGRGPKGMIPQDNLSAMRAQYQALGVEPDNVRYGWINTGD